MDNFNNKRILLFAPKFFNYEIEIKNKLEKLGAVVDFYDERANSNNLTKILIRINKNLIKNKIYNYYIDIFERTKNEKYDFILFISPETITKELIEKLKNHQKNAKFILYMWDSIENKKNVKEIINKFDKHYSFDKKDCSKFDKFKFRPLFYLDEYALKSNSYENDCEICFIGTVHSDRYKILKELKNQSLEKKLQCYFFMYFPSKLLFYIKKLTDKSYINTDVQDFNFSSISKDKILNKISKSKVIIDIQHPKQTGLTMRTIEMLGMKKKLITTNEDIKNYDFYNPNNINIIDRNKVNLDEKFIKSEYVDINIDIYKRYSLEEWLKEIFFNF